MNEQFFLKQMSVFTDSTRLKIISILSKSNFCSIHLEKLTGASQPNISRHIDKMIMVNIVDVKRIGRRNIYQLNDDFVKSNSELINQVNALYENTFNEDLIKDFSTECKNMN